jgi:hypothetical protein
VFKNAEEVAAYLTKNLPTPEMMRARPRLDVDPTATTMVPGPHHEQYMAVRLYFDAKQEYARWVLQDDDGHKPFEHAGLKFSSSKTAFDYGRDLVLDGYWKDIMLLAALGQTPADRRPRGSICRL